MEVRCEKCQARYRVDDARIGPQGLTMRCGKCQNTFKVMREPPKPAAPPPAARPAAPKPSEGPATVIFAAPPIPRPTASAQPAAAKPPDAAPKSPAPPPAAAAESAGRTMMFQTGNLKTTSPGAKAKPAADGEGRSTMMFVQPPGQAKSSPTPPPQRALGAGSTLPFAAASSLSNERAARTEPPPRAEAFEEDPTPTDPQPAEFPDQPEPLAGEAAQEEPGEPMAKGRFDRAPPKALLIGMGAMLLTVFVLAGALVATKKLGRHAPPAPAIEMLGSAQADADLDSLASLASAEGKAKDALEVAGPKSRFPEAIATVARIDIQWADALNDQAARLLEKNPDDARAAALQGEAKTKLKEAFDALSAAEKEEKTSADLQLGWADYYRAQHKSSSMNKYLNLAKDDPRSELVQALALAEQDEGADKAIPRLKGALAQNPKSARIHYRLAGAYLSLKDSGNAIRELKETLRLSPQHERARSALERLGAGGAAQTR